ncbi:MAG: ABC transporter permease subunit [Gemmatimonadota bacterium]
MNAGRIRAVVLKDWSELVQERTLIATSVGVPLLLITVYLALALYAPRIHDLELPSVDRPAVEALTPVVEALGRSDRLQVLLLRQMLLMLLVIPELATMAIATYSVIGEKRARSLEPLLATPITTAELLAAKSLVAGIPGIGITWMAFGLAAAVLAATMPPAALRSVFDPGSLLLVLVIAPLVALLGLSLGVIASARTSDPRTAQQIGVVVILPLIAVLILQLEGLFLLTPERILVGALALLVVDVLVLTAGVRIFRRETILTRWKS